MTYDINTSGSVNADWYMYYTRKSSPEIATLRISAGCLGDATDVAKCLAQQCRLELVGVARDLGVEEEPK